MLVVNVACDNHSTDPNLRLDSTYMDTYVSQSLVEFFNVILLRDGHRVYSELLVDDKFELVKSFYSEIKDRLGVADVFMREVHRLDVDSFEDKLYSIVLFYVFRYFLTVYRFIEDNLNWENVKYIKGDAMGALNETNVSIWVNEK